MNEQPNEPGRGSARDPGVGHEAWRVSVSGGSGQPMPQISVGQPQQQAPQSPADKARFSTGISFGLWCLLFVGLGGIHRLYLGKFATGFLWLFTFGLFGVGQLIDLFRMEEMVLMANVRASYVPGPRRVERLARDAEFVREQRKLAPPDTLEQSLLKAAEARGGVLTVAQGVLATGLPFAQVDATLKDLHLKGYAQIGNAPESGVIFFRFPGVAGTLE